MSKIKDIELDLISCGDVISVPFTICGEGSDVNDLEAAFNVSDGASVKSVGNYNYGVYNESSWKIETLQEGSFANIVVQIEVEDDSKVPFTVSMNVNADCINECITKSIKGLTCSKIKKCVSEGEIDCELLTKPTATDSADPCQFVRCSVGFTCENGICIQNDKN